MIVCPGPHTQLLNTAGETSVFIQYRFLLVAFRTKEM